MRGIRGSAGSVQRSPAVVGRQPDVRSFNRATKLISRVEIVRAKITYAGEQSDDHLEPPGYRPPLHVRLRNSSDPTDNVSRSKDRAT